jgi:hypothetical protein
LLFRQPCSFNLGDWLEDLKSYIRIAKNLHKQPFDPNKPPGPLEPNIVFKIDAVTIEFEDDSFEVKLGMNYHLMAREHLEQVKRAQALEDKIAALRSQSVLDIEDKLAELQAFLIQRNDEVYLKKSKTQYLQPLRTHAVRITINHLVLAALTEPLIHGKHNIVARLRATEPLAPYPNTPLDYLTLFARKVELRWSAFELQLRDYPQPLVRASETRLHGLLIIEEVMPPPQSMRTDHVVVGNCEGGGVGDVRIKVRKGMTPIKVYHDLRWTSKELEVYFGACVEPVLAQFSVLVDLLSNPSVDPSPPLMWFDKMRLLRHGVVDIRVDTFTLGLLASYDPYDARERLDAVLSGMRLQWANHKIALECDTKLFIRTASRFNNAPFLHMPDMRCNVSLVWRCRGSPDAHHTLFPHAPEHMTAKARVSWDTYRDYRSQHLELKLLMESCPKYAAATPINPTVLLYAGTCRFLSGFANVMADITRPIRRGPLFQAVTPRRKTTLGQHLQRAQMGVTMPGLLLLYYNSPNRTEGVRVSGEYLAYDHDFPDAYHYHNCYYYDYSMFLFLYLCPVLRHC